MFIHLLIITFLSVEGLHSSDYGLKGRFKERRAHSFFRQRISSAMENNGVVPDVIDIAPSHYLQVLFRSGVAVGLGNELTPLQVKDEPTVNWPIERGMYYTLMMIDPDAPNRTEPIWGEVKHWIVVNIPETDLNNGETLVPFTGSTPPEGTGLHRYIFLVYKQSGLLKHSEPPFDANNIESRLKFRTREFVKKYNLGQPFAGNFYQAQSDEHSKAIWERRAQMTNMRNTEK